MIPVGPGTLDVSKTMSHRFIFQSCHQNECRCNWFSIIFLRWISVLKEFHWVAKLSCAVNLLMVIFRQGMEFSHHWALSKLGRITYSGWLWNRILNALKHLPFHPKWYLQWQWPCSMSFSIHLKSNTWLTSPPAMLSIIIQINDGPSPVSLLSTQPHWDQLLPRLSLSLLHRCTGMIWSLAHLYFLYLSPLCQHHLKRLWHVS